MTKKKPTQADVERLVEAAKDVSQTNERFSGRVRDKFRLALAPFQKPRRKK